jgi:hypothetical protein
MSSERFAGKDEELQIPQKIASSECSGKEFGRTFINGLMHSTAVSFISTGF